MNEYLAGRLVKATADFCAACFNTVGELEPKGRIHIKEEMTDFVRETEFLGLPLTCKAAKSLVTAVETETKEEIGKRFNDIQSRFDDESENLTLFYIHQDALKYYNKTDLFGDEFKNKFPLSNSEVIEAGNCFAFDRFTACVIHLMRSLEMVLKVLFQTLGLPPLKTAGAQNWNGLLREIKDKLDADKTISDHQFYEAAYAFLAAAKNPLRNATLHVDVTYSDESSVRPVWLATEAFMRHIATKLSEAPPPALIRFPPREKS